MITALSFVKLYINIDIFFQHSLCMELSSTHPQFYRCWNLSWVFWLFWDLLLFLFRGAFEVCRPFEGRDTLKKSNIHKRALTVRPGSEVNQFLEFQCLTWLLCFLIPQRFTTKIDSYVAKWLSRVTLEWVWKTLSGRKKKLLKSFRSLYNWKKVSILNQRLLFKIFFQNIY